MLFLRSNKWKIVLILIFILIVCTAVMLVVRAVNHKRAAEYKASMKKYWALISERAEAFASELNNIKSKSDLPVLKEVATAFKEAVDDAYKEIEDNPPPSSIKELHEKQLSALQSISKYLDSIIGLSSEENINEIDDRKAVLENRARKASEDFNEFAAMDDYNGPAISGDVFVGAARLSEVAKNRGEAYEQEAEAVYQALKVFMDADITSPNGEVLWNMLSKERKAAYEKMGGNKDSILQYRNAQWRGSVPKGYYISKSSINFPSPGVAEANVIAYMEKGMSKKAKVQLVQEPDGWKIFGYPFLGLAL